MNNHWQKEGRKPAWVANQLIHGFLKKEGVPEMNEPEFRDEVSNRLKGVGYRLVTYNDSEWWGALNNEESLEKLMTRRGLDVRARALIAVLWRELIWPKVNQTNGKNKNVPFITETAFRDKYWNLIGYICSNKAFYKRFMGFLYENKFVEKKPRRRLTMKKCSVLEAGPALELWIDRDAIQTAMDQTYLLHSEGGQLNAEN